MHTPESLGERYTVLDRISCARSSTYPKKTTLIPSCYIQRFCIQGFFGSGSWLASLPVGISHVMDVTCGPVSNVSI
jgi:hypothetical protein